MSIHLPSHILALDFETTGLSPQYDHPISIAAMEFLDGAWTGKMFYKTIRPSLKSKVSIEALAVQAGTHEDDAEYATKLSDMLRAIYGCDNSPKDVMQEFTEWMFENNLTTVPVVAHNALFDMSFFAEKLECFTSVHKGNAISPIAICTKRLACHVFPKEKPRDARSLDACLLALGLDGRAEKGHNALMDAEAAGRLYFALKEKIENA